MNEFIGRERDAEAKLDLLCYLRERGISPCIASRSNRKVHGHCDKMLCRQRHKIENVFARIKDWRRVATRCDRCARTFMPAISIAATLCCRL